MIRKLLFFLIIIVCIYVILNYVVESRKLDNFLDKYSTSAFVLKAAPSVHYYLGLYYFYTHKPHKAIARFNILLDKFPDSKYTPNALYNLARSYEETSDIPKAKNIYKKLIKEFPQHRLSNIAEKKLYYYK